MFEFHYSEFTIWAIVFCDYLFWIWFLFFVLLDKFRTRTYFGTNSVYPKQKHEQGAISRRSLCKSVHQIGGFILALIVFKSYPKQNSHQWYIWSPLLLVYRCSICFVICLDSFRLRNDKIPLLKSFSSSPNMQVKRLSNKDSSDFHRHLFRLIGFTQRIHLQI